VGGVLVHEGRVLLIRRGQEPLLGRWTVPGGTVELGEGLEEALVREMREETALQIEPLEVLAVFDRIRREEGRIVYHYVIVDYLCRWRGGEARAGSDALEVAWAAPTDLEAYNLPAKAIEVVGQAFARVAAREGLPPGLKPHP
jgi:ADP-ribose pyrophosphatase YjhB (NUDIX family)